MQTPIDYTEGQYVHTKHSKSALFYMQKFRKVCENIIRLKKVLKFLIFFYFYDNFNLCCEYMSPQTCLFLVNHFYYVSFDREFEDIC